jgi:hypothetical protein
MMAAVLLDLISRLELNEPGKLIMALIINGSVYILIFKLMSGIQKDIMKVGGMIMLFIILLISLILFPAIFYPIHFLIKGEGPDFTIILKHWSFQVLVNGMCLFLNFTLLSKKINR